MNNDFIETIKDTIIPLAGAFLLILNIWLAYKLGPITQDLAVLRTTVLANEHIVDSLETRLVRVEDKLDNALEFIYSK